jgi:MoxR-like ATPase
MRLELGYPDEDHERSLLTGQDRRDLLQEVEPTLNAQVLIGLQEEAAASHVSEPLVDYIQALVRFTRESPEIETGLSPRGSLALIAAARAHAYIQHHAGVFPDDVQAVFAAIAGHRLKPASGSSYGNPGELSRYVLDSVAIP